jgi:crotonobetainyl-CoA:carnitine CoA-transferase CaiB-like acyl-CoA transferase
MDRDDLLGDDRFSTPSARADNNEAINGLVADWVAGLDAVEVERRCVEHDVPVGTAYDAADLAADEHVRARGDLVTVDDPVAGPVLQQASFPRLVGEEPPPPTGAPRLGEHTDEVLGGLLGLSDRELAALRADGVI